MLRSTPPFAVAALLLAGVTGCSSEESRLNEAIAKLDPNQEYLPAEVEALLSAPHETELLSLNPEWLDDPPDDSFHRFEVLGQTPLTAEESAAFFEALRAGVATRPDLPPPDCFNPRHGVRITSGDQSLDIAICFECEQIYSYRGDEQIGSRETSVLPATRYREAVSEHGLTAAPSAQ
ncbi:hypothetical protein Pla123a_27120 [Posidoniimonas polymericola]|uniref:Uncharacterized protein n=1 Tax=Posidoniimonas polymericola TaxID=2528002 RepID=A0A5C5YM94_9BACT|nr:hypothetical protein [Posidoniimonas polymericola]TWT75927.1 hypothetical protein Pla123a_27120 [Posidoniimonas polymericola]